MAFKGQEEDNRQQLSKITKGAIFRVICHCLLHGGLAFLLVFGVLSPTARTSIKVASIVVPESLQGLWLGVSTSVEKVKPEKH